MDDFDDIPVARRDTRTPPRTLKSGIHHRTFWLTGLVAGAIALLAGAAASFVLYSTRQATTAATSPLENESLAAAGSPSSGASASADTNNGLAPTSDSERATKETEAILGHYPYQEVSPDRLLPIAPGIQLASEAAEAYLQMESAARADGIRLVPISGFRSKADQEYLFFEIKGERGQTAEQRAKVSAPPGHSEHHTGYALDIGDADAGGAILSESFEETGAFKWLEKNAPYYSFELSFPRGNEQGVSYEPWHWRYVGNQESLEIFHKGK